MSLKEEVRRLREELREEGARADKYYLYLHGADLIFAGLLGFIDNKILSSFWCRLVLGDKIKELRDFWERGMRWRFSWPDEEVSASASPSPSAPPDGSS